MFRRLTVFRVLAFGTVVAAGAAYVALAPAAARAEGGGCKADQCEYGSKCYDSGACYNGAYCEPTHNPKWIQGDPQCVSHDE